MAGRQRQGFKWFWRWISKAKRVGRPRIPQEVQELIRRMAQENGWGAPRNQGELLKLGIFIEGRTVSRYLPRGHISPDKLQSRLAFLRNHRDTMVGMDFFTVPTVTFRLLWVFVVLHHERRRILQLAVTSRPEAPWVIQQLREAFPFDTAPRYAILDRGGKYGHAVPAALQSMGLKPVRTALLLNGVRTNPEYRGNGTAPGHRPPYGKGQTQAAVERTKTDRAERSKEWPT